MNITRRKFVKQTGSLIIGISNLFAGDSSYLMENDESIYTITVDHLPGSRNARIEYRKAV